MKMWVPNRPASNQVGLTLAGEKISGNSRLAGGQVSGAWRDRQNRQPGQEKKNASDETRTDMATSSDKVANFGSLADS